MRILIEPSDYPELRNLGDIAMMQTALGRIAKLWPDARIQVLSDTPEALPKYGANVEGITATGRHAWMSGLFPGRGIPEGVRILERSFRNANVGLGEQLASAKLKLHSPQRADALSTFLETTRATDLLVVCGMGGVADVFERYALDLLDTIDLVKSNGRGTVAMFGQAFGPIGDGTPVAMRAREVLPRVDLIGLREARASMPLLKRLGVDTSRAVVTGDDALEVAAVKRRTGVGDSVGMNVRVASYSELTLEHAARMRPVIQGFAEAKKAPIQPLPTSLHREESDADSIRHVTEGYGWVGTNDVSGPESLIDQVQRCRVAVVGSYHAGVYSLAQGVPIVGLYDSDYYRDKFLGLEALFGSGVFPVDLSGADWAERLVAQMDAAWGSSPSLRGQIIEQADRQIEAGREAYNRLYKMVEERSADR